MFIDQAEKTFIKKVSKTDKSDPKRLRKDLPKLVKNIAPEDQVRKYNIVNNVRNGVESDDSDWELPGPVGVRPEGVDPGVPEDDLPAQTRLLLQVLLSMLLRFIQTPIHRYSLWKELIISAGGNISHSEFDLSSLTKISDGWTSGSICK